MFGLLKYHTIMIYKDQNISGITPYALAEFGNGDIAVLGAGGKFDDYSPFVQVCLKNIPPQLLGTGVEVEGGLVGKPTNEFKPEIILLFNKVESIDILLECLTSQREKLLKELTTP